MTHVLLTLAVSAAAGLFLQRRHIPAGMLIGAIAASAVLSAVFRVGDMPHAAKTASQLVAGVFIGCSASKEDLRQLRQFYKPVLTVAVSLLLLNLLIGTALFAVSYSDLLTCLVCAIPGGISDVTLIAVDFGADPSKVLLIHFCRLIIGVVVFPLLVNRYTEPVEENRGIERGSVEPPRHNTLRILLFFTAAAVGAYVGRGIPSGVILCALLVSFGLRLAGIEVRMPRQLRRAAQVLSGAYIGCLLDPAAFTDLPAVLWSLVITMAVLLADAVFFGKLMERYFQIPLREGMMMLSPAGASDIALISADIGLNSPRLVLTQVFRLLVATAVFPQICLTVYQLLQPCL